MGLIRLAIRQPVTVVSVVVLLLLAGLVAVRQLPIQLTPTIDDTVVSVSTRWDGAGPEEVEQRDRRSAGGRTQGDLRPRGDDFDERAGRRHDPPAVPPRDRQGGGAARGERAASSRAALSRHRRRAGGRGVGPGEPRLHRVDGALDERSDARHPHLAGLRGGPHQAARSSACRASPRSTCSADASGRSRIRFDPEAPARLGLSVSDVRRAIVAANRDVSAGLVEDAKFDVRLRTMGQAETPEDLESIVIAESPAGPVFLRDVAEVAEDYRRPDSFVRNRGRPVIALNAQRDPGSNVIEVMDGIKAELRAMNEPEGLLESQARVDGSRRRPEARAGVRSDRLHRSGARTRDREHLARRLAGGGDPRRLPAFAAGARRRGPRDPDLDRRGDRRDGGARPQRERDQPCGHGLRGRHGDRQRDRRAREHLSGTSRWASRRCRRPSTAREKSGAPCSRRR